MSAKNVPLDQVPGIKVVREILYSLDPTVSVVAAGDDFDKEVFVLKLDRPKWKGRVSFEYELLHDIQQDQGQNGNQYTRKLQDIVKLKLRKAVENNGEPAEGR